MKTPETGNLKLSKATFAGGCFWCMQPPFEKLDGVKSVVVGYTGGRDQNPSYDEVCSGTTGHYEAVQVTYDPAKVRYETLLKIFWENHDPTDHEGQFADKGSQYKAAIFYHDEAQRILAEKSKKDLEDSCKFGVAITTAILPAQEFYPAEEYHQDYYKKNSEHYKRYKIGSGRAEFLEEYWGNR